MKLKKLIEKNIYKSSLNNLPINKKCVINTVNAYSYCKAKTDPEFLKALLKSNVLLPDGVAIVMAAKLLNNIKIKKIAGADIHHYLLEKANRNHQKVFYLGASEETLKLISTKVYWTYPNIKISSFSPPYKKTFSKEENSLMLEKINAFKPDILFVGMTAPKQEKWVETNKNNLEVNTIVAIGAVFDFYAGTVNRAPDWMINKGLEWLYRLFKEPKRMWRRYLIGNTKFLYYLIKEKLNFKNA